MSDRVAIEVIPLNVADQDSVEAARQALSLSIDKFAVSADVTSALGASLNAAWTEIPAGLPRALLTPVSDSPYGQRKKQIMSYEISELIDYTLTGFATAHLTMTFPRCNFYHL